MINAVYKNSHNNFTSEHGTYTSVNEFLMMHHIQFEFRDFIISTK